MKHLVIGTAGHVDHGKTSLIKALTGIDTDRLKEEKQRGITIELGFASLVLPSGQILGIVDVPGHEKFIKNMVAGASGIDLVMMVIAADEGIMPQTKEHLQICSLLGISKGIIALTKIDLVEREWLELVKTEIEEFFQQTFLQDAPVIPISVINNKGIQDLISAIDTIVRTIPEKRTITFFVCQSIGFLPLKGSEPLRQERWFPVISEKEKMSKYFLPTRKPVSGAFKYIINPSRKPIKARERQSTCKELKNQHLLAVMSCQGHIPSGLLNGWMFFWSSSPLTPEISRIERLYVCMPAPAKGWRVSFYWKKTN